MQETMSEDSTSSKLHEINPTALETIDTTSEELNHHNRYYDKGIQINITNQIDKENNEMRDNYQHTNDQLDEKHEDSGKKKHKKKRKKNRAQRNNITNIDGVNKDNSDHRCPTDNIKDLPHIKNLNEKKIRHINDSNTENGKDLTLYNN